jgi:hypothetical protein
MHRPIGVSILAILAGVAGLYEIWRTAFFLGLVKVTVVGQDVTFTNPQWGQALWALLIAAIWFWVAKGLFEMRAYAWSFGIYISLFTMIFSFFAIIGTSTFEQEFPVMFIAVAIFMYLNYPGVRDQFMKHEMSLLTPEQRAAVEKAQAANVAAAQAMAAGNTTPPAPPAPPAAG